MTTHQTTTSDNDQDLDKQIQDLLDEAKKTHAEIETDAKETAEAMDDIEKRVDESADKLEKIYAELEEVDKESEDDLDKLILEEAETLATEE